mmetsp:Transcript_59675/g.176827  ORF Transcript_59675/g.176827 Transcript_59675/m.176827 type:complete len:971 (-) Transcript_59675:116-3028(-)
MATSVTPSSSEAVAASASNEAIGYSEESGSHEESVNEHTEEVLLAAATCNVVGLQYYDGVAHRGEFINLVREPSNPYDRNAIRVDNVHGEKVGHIKATQASGLAPILDAVDDRAGVDIAYSNVTKVDGIIPRPAGTYTMPVRLEFYGNNPESAETDAEVLQWYLSNSGIKLETARKRGSSSSARGGRKGAGKSPTAVRAKTVTVRDWKSQSELDAMFDKQRSLLASIPSTHQPLQLTSTLLPHQSVGLSWLVHRETARHNRLFWKNVKERGKSVWLSEITNASQRREPRRVRGGLLCDEMGMGKSLMTLALILSHPPTPFTYPDGMTNSEDKTEKSSDDEEKVTKSSDAAVESSSASAVSKRMKVDSSPPTASVSKAAMSVGAEPSDGCISTLIVCPVSVLSNWMEQVELHVHPNVLRVVLYHGPNRYSVLPRVHTNQIDILLVSYNTLAMDFKAYFSDMKKSKKRKRADNIFDIRFHRIVLDEAHIIRNINTKISSACLTLNSKYKLALTGTPLQNKSEDLQPQLKFLGLEPFSDKEVFRRSIAQPIRNGDNTGLACLRAVMCHVALRRTKDKEGVQLAKKSVQVCSIEFPAGSVHESIYNTLFQSAQEAFGAILRDGEQTALKEYMSILETLLRIRQACCSGMLIPKERLLRAEEVLAEVEALAAGSGKPLSTEEGKKLLDKLKGVFGELDTEGGISSAECAICLEDFPQENASILRTCSHVFCQECIVKVSSMHNHSCPLCREVFQKSDIVKMSAASTAANKPEESVPSDGGMSSSCVSASDEELSMSPKVAALLQAITDMKSDEKAVIFSQFTSFLDIIARALETAGYTFTRIDGKMNAKARIKAMRDFNSEEESSPRFILCSLMAAGTGINLTRGNHAFLMDLWWNKSVEDQAMDRIHRIGQKRDVRVIKFVMEGSIETRVIKMQEMKAAMGKGAMEKISPAEMRKARVSALKDLFLIQSDENTD